MNRLWIAFCGVTLSLSTCAGPAVAAFSEPANSTYACQPVFMSNSVPPNILLLLDNSGSMNELAYPSGDTYQGAPYGTKVYYGYFNPDYFYSYSSNKFAHLYRKIQYVGTPRSGGYWQTQTLAGATYNLLNSSIETNNSSGLWDGNFLNFVAMRKVDIMRKVIVGGLATSRTGGGNTNLIGHSSTNYYNHGMTVTATGAAVTPYSATDRIYEVYNGYLDVYSSWSSWSSWSYAARLTIKVDKNELYEPEDFLDGKIVGVMQRIDQKARWGNEWFKDGTGSSQSGGYIDNTVTDGNITNIITGIENKAMDTWTPLAEAYYVAAQYFAQEDPATGLDYSTSAVPHANNNQDPYHNGTEFVSCAKSFVLMITDGASTKDSKIPATLKDFDADGVDNTSCDESAETNCDYSMGGTNYLDDVALWARTTDLRSATKGKTNISGAQNLYLYAVYAAFGAADSNAVSLLKDAARNGGFEDRNGNNLPDGTYASPADQRLEWDADGDGLPDTYYQADDGYELEQKILAAINDILKRAASGTAVSVLSTSSSGEGNLVQAFFRPELTVGTDTIKWLGYLQSFWVDAYGNMREDSANNVSHPDTACRTGHPNKKLDIGCDRIIQFYLDAVSGDTKLKRFEVSSSTPYPDLSTATYTTIDLDEASALWQADKLLAERDPATRKIFTFIDKDNDATVDDLNAAGTTSQWQSGVSWSQFDYINEIVSFVDGSVSSAAAAAIRPYLGVRTSTWSWLGSTHDTRRDNLIKYIRGTDISGLRSRTFDYDEDGTDETWKLGDIINSTPVQVSKPVENYHVIYADESYQKYYDAFKDRETVVYVGANDGMLHAFTSWKYDAATKGFTQPSGTTDAIGAEIWAYIPQALLPHLKWLASTSYNHTFYVDLKAKVFDAKILADDTHYADADGDPNWGTFLLLGLNLGGGSIQANEDFNYNGTVLSSEIRTFTPSYTLIDITEPRNPRVMWEKSYGNLQTSASFPAVVKVKNKWFAVFGSGPTNCSTGESAQTGKIFVVDLDTGAPYKNGSNDWLFQTAESNAFLNGPVSLDKGLNNNVDAIYIGETYKSGVNQLGKVYKVMVPWVTSGGLYDGANVNNYIDNPKHASSPWLLKELANIGRPVTAPLSLSIDAADNVWVYGGTGRYLTESDKSNTDGQYIFGIKDPFYNKNYQTGSPVYYHSYTANKGLTTSNLLDATGLLVTDKALVFNANGTVYGSQGTFTELLANVASVDGWRDSLTGGERVLSKPTLLGGIVLVPAFTPNSTTCGYSGTSNLYGLYFLTGTAYKEGVFADPVYTQVLQGSSRNVVRRSISLGQGLASTLGVHVGSETGAKGFVQMSTGQVVELAITPALKIKSGITAWMEE